MKLLVLLLVTGLATSMPRKGNRPSGPKQEKEDPSTIIRCMAENWQNGENHIKACRDCFMAVNDNLTKAKACVSEFLKMENEACSSEIAALKSFTDEEKFMSVLQCFDATLEIANNDRCLKESQSTDVAGKLKDGSMCVMDSWKYGMAYVKNATMGKGGKGKRPRAGKKSKEMKGQVMKLITKAHCNLASEGDDTKSTHCLQCFSAAVKLGKQGKGKGGKKGMSPELVSALTTCSEQHLNPKYAKCTTMMKDTAAAKKDTHKCYMAVLVNNLVVKCSEGVTEATSDTLSGVMACGKEATIDWVKKNASAEVAEKIGNFLDEEEDEDEDIEG